MDRYFGVNPTRRFLVADATGLGKSIVARGVIASLIERLQDDDTIGRIDVVYVCSNTDIAQQNISRLDVTGDPHLPFSSRLTLLAKEGHRLTSATSRYAKPVNLISFTPGTSFELGWQTGTAEERALLYRILVDEYSLTGSDATAAAVIFQGTVTRLDRFRSTIGHVDGSMPDGPDPTVTHALLAEAKQRRLTRRFLKLIDDVGRRRRLTAEQHERARRLIGELRSELARASVETLEPDLVILDEFQRFRHLLDPEQGGAAAELAHHLFNYRDARVLMLSATPYKPFTYAEEIVDGEDHYRDFTQTLRFLADGSALAMDDLLADLSAFRQSAIKGQPVAAIQQRLRNQLLHVMCRTERPQHGAGDLLVERTPVAEPVTADDLCAYVALSDLARELDAPMNVDYWKSAPYFVNFLDGYQLGERLRSALQDPQRRAELQPLITRTQRLRPGPIRHYAPLDAGNARLRTLIRDTLDQRWWELLWIPPSLPYTTPAGPYDRDPNEMITKRLVFSSWVATPTAIAALVSYDAERRIAEGTRLTENTAAGRRAITARLDYRLDAGRPAAMSTLALFWPHPGLAEACDPLVVARTTPGTPPTLDELHTALEARLQARLPPNGTNRATTADAWYWAAALQYPNPLPPGTDPETITGSFVGRDDSDENTDDDTDDHAGIAAHVTLALSAIDNAVDLPRDPPPDLTATVTQLGAHAPGNIAWRAVQRLLADTHHTVTPAGQWHAACLIANGLRTLFNRTETILLLDRLLPEITYWRAVLTYCAWGNLQAVLDEYLHHLANHEGALTLTDQELLRVARAARNALAIRPSPYEAFDPTHPDRRIRFSSRFALRFGSRRQTEDSARQPEVRNAFNSPFWPFILATTSVGQEGIDFHWWCHAVVHWNTVANPVDFEQREGRVDRYEGHAIRRNIVARHREAILGSAPENPWRAAYEIAVDYQSDFGELSPHWVYPGPARIERHTYPYPLSRDYDRIERVREDLALYRLTFGQPRQEDLLELLRRRGVQHDPDEVAELTLDLTPPPQQ
jgi:hypothetical protein